MSPEKDQEYFSDGIAEELLNLLAQVTQLRVIARTSSFSFKGRNVPIEEIARQLNVSHVLEGSVRKSGNKLRITAQLVRAVDSAHVWSATYDRSLDDIFAVQDEIAAHVVEQLKIRLLGAAPAARATDPAAYALYLQARQLHRQGAAAGHGSELALLEQALELDPGYVPAWTLKSGIHGDQAATGSVPAPAGWRCAREAVNRALALDPGDCVVHARMGWIAIVADRDLAAAANHFGRALVLAPADDTVLRGAATLLLCLGRLQAALAVHEWVVARDPVNARLHVNLGLANVWAGRHDAALISYRTALRLSPRMMGAEAGVAHALRCQGRPAQALEVAQQEPVEVLRLLATTMILHDLGRAADSDAALAETIEKYAPDFAYNIAYVLAYRGETDRAFQWLDKAMAFNDGGLSEIAVQPEFSSLHDDPRWQPFLRRIGMAPEQLDAIPFEVKLPT
jgi:TolB-like protein